MNIRQETLDKTTAYLNDLASIRIGGKFTFGEEISLRRKHKVNSNIKSSCINLGFFKKIGNAQYIATIENFQPIHSRRAIEFMYERYPSLTVSTYKSVKKSKKKKPVTKAIQEVKQNKKSFSFLWGLIKINY